MRGTEELNQTVQGKGNSIPNGLPEKVGMWSLKDRPRSWACQTMYVRLSIGKLDETNRHENGTCF